MSRATALGSALNALADRMARDMPDNEAARAMLAEVNRLRTGAEALNKVDSYRSPTETVGAHIKKIGTMAKRFEQESTASINRAVAAQREGLTALRRRIDDKVNLKPDPYAEEIRAVFRGMKQKERLELLSKLVDENRGPELAAIIKAPQLTTGLPADMRARFHDAIVLKHARPEFEETAKLIESLETVVAAAKAARELSQSLTDPDRLAEIEKGEAAAGAAGEAFNQALATQ